MSIISTLRQHLPSNPNFSCKTLNPKSILHRTYYAQPILQLQHQFDEVEIDPKKLPTNYDPSKFDPSAHRSSPSNRVFRLVDDVSQLKFAEIAELGSILMNKMGMKEDEPPLMGVLNPNVAAEFALMAAKSG